MSAELQQRVEAMAAKGRERATRPPQVDVAREWWSVTKPGGDVVETFVCPAQTLADLQRMRPGCGVQAIDRMSPIGVSAEA